MVLLFYFFQSFAHLVKVNRISIERCVEFSPRTTYYVVDIWWVFQAINLSFGWNIWWNVVECEGDSWRLILCSISWCVLLTLGTYVNKISHSNQNSAYVCYVDTELCCIHFIWHAHLVALSLSSTKRSVYKTDRLFNVFVVLIVFVFDIHSCCFLYFTIIISDFNVPHK